MHADDHQQRHQPLLPEAVADERDADADSVGEGTAEGKHGAVAQPQPLHPAENHQRAVEHRHAAEKGQQHLRLKRLQPHLGHGAEEQRGEQRVEGDGGEAAQALRTEELAAADAPADQHHAEHRHDDVDNGVHILRTRHSRGASLLFLRGAGSRAPAFSPNTAKTREGAAARRRMGMRLKPPSRGCCSGSGDAADCRTSGRSSSAA
jgi:hypothetical protein